MTFDEVRKFAAGYKWCPTHRLWTLHACKEDELIFRENDDDGRQPVRSD